MASEKRNEYRDRLGVHIETEFGASSYGLFAELDLTEFKRVLSNLINNAIEALGDSGQVLFGLVRSSNRAVLSIRDNGKGIPADVLPQLMKMGSSFDKSGGTGLGLFHANEVIKNLGGSIELKSEVGVGTVVTVELPAAQAPAWFVGELLIGSNFQVVTLDDDLSIHEIWKQRFDGLGEQRLEIRRFSRADEFIDWYEGSESKSETALYLFDYELLKQELTGLDLIERMGLSQRAVLVTSRFEDAAIRERCLRLGVKMVPKPLASVVPIRCVQAPIEVDCILVDNDPIVIGSWQLDAKKFGKRLKAYSAPGAFLADWSRIKIDTPIYVDADLGEGARGEEFSRLIHEQGFREVFLATGYPSERFPTMPWVKGIVGKQSPWRAHAGVQQEIASGV